MRKNDIFTFLVFIMTLLLATESFAQRGMSQKGYGGWGPGNQYGRMYDHLKNKTLIGGGIMSNIAEKIDGKKFMWNKKYYSTGAEAEEQMDEYEKDGFETRLVKKEGKFLVYTRRIVTEIVLEEGGQPL